LILGFFEVEQFKRCHWNLPQTDPCCHANENLGFYIDQWNFCKWSMAKGYWTYTVFGRTWLILFLQFSMC